MTKSLERCRRATLISLASIELVNVKYVIAVSALVVKVESMVEQEEPAPVEALPPTAADALTSESKKENQVVWLTGWPAVGKTTMGSYLRDTHNWHLCDVDGFIDSDPPLKEIFLATVCRVFDLMRGTEGEAKKHDAEVRTVMEPFFHALYEKMTKIKQSKIVFAYVCWRQWMVDLFREYFPKSIIVDVQVTRSLLLDRFVEREAKHFEKEGNSHEALWRDDQGARFKLCREK